MLYGHNMENIFISILIILFLGINGSSDILQRQKRNWIIASFSIEEENQGPFPYSLGPVTVEKKYPMLKLRGQGVDEDPKNLLQINSATGDITVHGSVDYELFQRLTLYFLAYDGFSRELTTRLGVEVDILDINDNAPTFSREKYEVTLKESVSQGTFLVTVEARDKDSKKTNNGTFDFKIASITPKPIDLEFHLKQNGQSGNIVFNGCLDYERAKKYTILVEAKDRGEKIQLSSTCTVIVNIEDGNNHLPVFTGQTGPGSVTEGEANVTVLRLQVADTDSRGSLAWKAKYYLHGDKEDNFQIRTDPETNEGVLTAAKPLDYAAGSLRNLSVSVGNEAPYHTCKVRRVVSNARWDVEIVTAAPPLSTRHVTVAVKDTNNCPVFTDNRRHVTVEENVAVGYYLETFTATDVDTTYGNKIVYTIEDDPGDWVAVDSNTGRITTTKILDRESTFVKDNIYAVTVYAVDNGEPPMTGTGTLLIHLNDQNDNVPILTETALDMCLSDTPSKANLTVVDLDRSPYAGPYRYKLHGDVAHKWRIDPEYGHSASLVQETGIYTGVHELLLEVFDLQGKSSVQNFTVTVCSCPESIVSTPNCRVRGASRSTAFSGRFLWAIFAAMLLLLGIVLLVFLVSWKSEMKAMPDEGLVEHLFPCNMELPGDDCKVKLSSLLQRESPTWKANPLSCDGSTKSFDRFLPGQLWTGGQHTGRFMYYGEKWGGQFKRGTSVRKSNYAAVDTWLDMRVALSNTIVQRMSVLQAPGEELGDHAPFPYAEEGDLDTDPQLEAILIPDIPFDPDMLLYLGDKFNILASICRPDGTTSRGEKEAS